MRNNDFVCTDRVMEWLPSKRRIEAIVGLSATLLERIVNQCGCISLFESLNWPSMFDVQDLKLLRIPHCQGIFVTSFLKVLFVKE
jgi:hypothetical protein